MLVLRPIPLARRSLLRALQSTRPPHISLFYHSRNFGIRMGGGTHTVDTAARLAALRALMRARAPPVGAYVVPSEDAHASEYLAPCDERRAWISGFNGSAGCAVVTADDAYLFTDGRYFLQAEQQLDRNWSLMKQGLSDVPTWQDFLSKNLPSGTTIGLDPTVVSAADAATISRALAPRGSAFVPIAENLVDGAWGAARPARPAAPIVPLSVEFAGESHASKLDKLRAAMGEKNAKALVLSALDEIAWALNLRGADIAYNPVFFAYLLLTPARTTLFVDGAQLSAEAHAQLGKDVEVRPYGAFFEVLQGLGNALGLSADAPALVGDKASLAIEAALPSGAAVRAAPAGALKAIKNGTELAGFRAAHVRDGAALARYFAWLEHALAQGEDVDEVRGAGVLEAFRREGAHFRGLSFPTISAAGKNGAIIHYEPEQATCAKITRDELYLCDSGAQYSDGTTDVTRTLHFGAPTAEEKRAFTRVLQGHVAIATAVFPPGTTGYIIDSWARRALWADGLDYRHGTGHGVGHFLNVHEGPHGIGVRIAYNSTALAPGMTVSNEPGYYADGRFGIRIENVVAVREVPTPHTFGGRPFLGFENFTLCPIQRTLVEKELLAPAELAWLDAYHAEVLEKIGPLLANDERARAWLERECQPL